jgi:hypothetical protein
MKSRANWLGFFSRLCKLNSSSATYEVHDDRYKGKDQQQMNEEAADMQDEKSAQPEDNEHNRQNKKHTNPSFLSSGVAPGASILLGGRKPSREESLLRAGGLMFRYALSP